MRQSIYHAGTSRTVPYRDIEEQDETPGQFETLGSPRSHAHAQSANRLGQEGFNGVGSIKTDIYFTLGKMGKHVDGRLANTMGRYQDMETAIVQSSTNFSYIFPALSVYLGPI